jgi:uncharacterized protein (TIGR02466 family)
MEKQGIFSIDLYKFRCSQNLLQDTREKVMSLNWRSGMKNEVSGDLHRSDQFKEIHGWFQQCVNEVKNDLDLPFDSLPIVQSWSNRSLKGMWHHGHTHDFSFLSGIFYLNTADFGKTWFSVNNTWYDHSLIYFKIKDSKILIHREAPEEGKLVLFPSHIYHSVDNWENDEPRYSIAFNTFPCGRFGVPDEKCSLNLKIDDSNDYYEKPF